jgi:hypothetical protein
MIWCDENVLLTQSPRNHDKNLRQMHWGRATKTRDHALLATAQSPKTVIEAAGDQTSPRGKDV